MTEDAGADAVPPPPARTAPSDPPRRIDHAGCDTLRRAISAMQRFMAELGGRILFTSGKDSDTDLWCLDLGAQALRQLTAGSWRNWKGR